MKIYVVYENNYGIGYIDNSSINFISQTKKLITFTKYPNFHHIKIHEFFQFKEEAEQYILRNDELDFLSIHLVNILPLQLSDNRFIPFNPNSIVKGLDNEIVSTGPTFLKYFKHTLSNSKIPIKSDTDSLLGTFYVSLLKECVEELKFRASYVSPMEE